MLPPSGDGGVSTAGGGGGDAVPAGGGAELAGNNGWCRILLLLPDSFVMVLLIPFAVLTCMGRDRESVKTMMWR